MTHLKSLIVPKFAKITFSYNITLFLKTFLAISSMIYDLILRSDFM